MKQIPRIYYTAAQKTLMWDRWKAGDILHEIGKSIRSVARRLKRAASTISRELLRNGGKICYRAAKADESAWDRARRPKACKLTKSPGLAQIVAVKLQSQWCPEQIAG